VWLYYFIHYCLFMQVAELNELAQSHSVVCDINVLETNIMLKGLRSDVEYMFEFG